MFNATILLLGLAAGIIHLIVKRRSLNKTRGMELLVLYCIFFGIGLVSMAAFIGQVFFPERVASMLGWALSPLHKDIAIYAGVWGLLGLMAIWISGSFVHAVVIGWSVFMLGAGVGHITGASVPASSAAANFGSIYLDMGATLLIILLWAAWLGMRRYKSHHC